MLVYLKNPDFCVTIYGFHIFIYLLFSIDTQRFTAFSVSDLGIFSCKYTETNVQIRIKDYYDFPLHFLSSFNYLKCRKRILVLKLIQHSNKMGQRRVCFSRNYKHLKNILYTKFVSCFINVSFILSLHLLSEQYSEQVQHTQI